MLRSKEDCAYDTTKNPWERLAWRKSWLVAHTGEFLVDTWILIILLEFYVNNAYTEKFHWNDLKKMNNLPGASHD